MVPPVSRSGRVVCHGKFSVIMLFSSRARRRLASENDFAFIVAAGRSDGLVRVYMCAYIRAREPTMNLIRMSLLFRLGRIDKR